MNENSLDGFFDDDSMFNDEYIERDPLGLEEKCIKSWIEANCSISGFYKINNDSSIDVEGDITITNEDIKIMPAIIQFNEVLGEFSIKCGKLSSLKGSPKKVGGDFDCSYCSSLESLEGAPKEVGGNFDCSSCNSLKNLEHAPIKVGGNFNCSNCYSLESLAGMPETLSGSFYCVNCTSLKTLESAPDEVAGNFDCSGCNSLKSLESAPKVKGNFTCPGQLVG